MLLLHQFSPNCAYPVMVLLYFCIFTRCDLHDVVFLMAVSNYKWRRIPLVSGYLICLSSWTQLYSTGVRLPEPFFLNPRAFITNQSRIFELEFWLFSIWLSGYFSHIVQQQQGAEHWSWCLTQIATANAELVRTVYQKLLVSSMVWARRSGRKRNITDMDLGTGASALPMRNVLWLARVSKLLSSTALKSLPTHSLTTWLICHRI
jgi:hypothetical protein